MHSVISSLVQSSGYLSLFVLVALEGVGIPLPGETVLVTAAAFASSGQLSIYVVIGTAASAAIVGDNAGYWIGRRGGLALIQRYGRLLHVDESKIRRAHEFFDRHGAKTVLIGRFIALLRTWAAVLAGVGEMQYGIFMLYNALGGITWAVIFGTLGYTFGRNLPQMEHHIAQASLALVLLVTLAMALLLGARWLSADCALGVQIPKTGARRGTQRCSAVRSEKNLRVPLLEIGHQNSLPIRFKAALDLVYESNWIFSLMSCGNLEGSQPPRPCPPTRDRQFHVAIVRREAD
jgi:membrane protein DedA with SNARE-associated domain